MNATVAPAADTAAATAAGPLPLDAGARGWALVAGALAKAFPCPDSLDPKK